MIKWEYLTAPILTHRREADPRHFGSEGWELADRARHEPKLAELGITVPDVAPPVVVYQSAVATATGCSPPDSCP